MENTKTTTRPDEPPAWRARPAAFALLAFALGLIVLSGGLLRHDLALYRLHAVAKAIRFGEPVSNAGLAQAVQQAIVGDQDHVLNASDLDDAAQVASLFAERNRASFLAPSLQLTAENLLRARLAEAPADGNSWLRLAYVRTARIGLDPLAHAALRMSWLATPREFAVMWPSLRFRVAHWDRLTIEEQFAAADLVAGLWHKPPERDALQRFLAQLPPHLLSSLMADMVDSEARAALQRS